ncbi:hypothetical protein [Ancylobacter polymorphus]|uniref:Uncharacterized protein n=1 Tax=Ancylobacter polymorphus TaxID=223390 RepID=A0ABU0BJH8_9HYPH|nr:hypothetical protein [Ancylobacter polymorphus]MDQ0305423.1 hypothetical protein [Ancylobacter polymorphus]
MSIRNQLSRQWLAEEGSKHLAQPFSRHAFDTLEGKTRRRLGQHRIVEADEADAGNVRAERCRILGDRNGSCALEATSHRDGGWQISLDDSACLPEGGTR